MSTLVSTIDIETFFDMTDIVPVQMPVLAIAKSGEKYFISQVNTDDELNLLVKRIRSSSYLDKEDLEGISSSEREMLVDVCNKLDESPTNVLLELVITSGTLPRISARHAVLPIPYQ